MGVDSESEEAAAAAKSLQLCLTLCDPRDGSPPGSPVPGILQARTLEWVAISFSGAWKWKVKVKSLSHVRLLATPWTAAHQAPPSTGFSRQEYWSGVPLPSPTHNWATEKQWQGVGGEGESWLQDDLSTLHLLCTLFLLLLHQLYLISSGIRSLRSGSPGFCHQLWGHLLQGSSSSNTYFSNLKGHFLNLPTTNFVNQEIFMLFYQCKILFN